MSTHIAECSAALSYVAVRYSERMYHKPSIVDSNTTCTMARFSVSVVLLMYSYVRRIMRLKPLGAIHH